MKIFMIPPNSLILYDLVERFGHQPLSLMGELREHVVKPEIESPPLNLSQEDIMNGLKYAGIEVPSGVRGRLGIWGPMVDEAEAEAELALFRNAGGGTLVDVTVPGATKSERNRVISHRIMQALARLLGQEWQSLEDNG